MDNEVTLAEVADRDLLEALYAMVADIHEALALDEDDDHDDEGDDRDEEREESSTDDHDDEEHEEHEDEEAREEELATATS